MTKGMALGFPENYTDVFPENFFVEDLEVSF